VQQEVNMYSSIFLLTAEAGQGAATN
jgi:hypothetical protein